MSEASAATSSSAGRWAAWWDSFYAAWVQPITQLVLVALAVLIVLLVLAQLATRLLVRDRATGWPSNWTWWARLSGLALMVTGSVLLTSVLAATRTAWITLSLGIVVSLAGVVIAAAGNGRRLGLRVEVLGKDGQPDKTAMDYVVARLLALGSASPRGLETPQQTDVTSLPEDALSTLPQAKVAVAVLRALQAVLPTAPWRARAAFLDDTQLTMTLIRNGSTVQTQTFRWPPLKLVAAHAKVAASTEDAAYQRVELLTAASAFILCELAGHHRTLREGLCGATNWQSVAAQAIATEPATDPTAKPGAAWQRALLAYAVEADPYNIAAHVAYMVALGGRRDADPEAQRSFLKRLEAVNDRCIPCQDGEVKPGWHALALRVHYMITVVRLNLRTAAHNGDQQDLNWEKLRDAAESLISFLDKCSPCPEQMGPGGRRIQSSDLLRPLAVSSQRRAGLRSDEALREFADTMKGPAYFLWQSTLDAVPQAERNRLRGKYSFVEQWIKSQGEHFLVRLSLTGHYNLACRYVQTDSDQALEHIAYTVANEDIRLDAQTDPYFERAGWQKKDPDSYKRFKVIVGDPTPTKFLDLVPFTEQEDKLAAIGIHNADELIRLSRFNPWRLAADLGLPVNRIKYWLQLAEFSIVLKQALSNSHHQLTLVLKELDK